MVILSDADETAFCPEVEFVLQTFEGGRGEEHGADDKSVTQGGGADEGQLQVGGEVHGELQPRPAAGELSR